jgi:hypothetical protein
MADGLNPKHIGYMLGPLHDADDELTTLGRVLSICALLMCVASGLALLPALMLGPLFATACDGPCSTVATVGVILVIFSPLLLLISTICGWFAFRYPTWGLLLFAVAPPGSVAAGFVLLGFR